MPAKHEPPQAPVSIDAANAWVWQGGRRLELAPKSFAVLRYLIEKAGQLVTKGELHTAVWGETIVSEAALLTCIRDIRKVLGDASRTPHYVETVHRRGFRFIGPIATTPPVQSSRFKVQEQNPALRTPHSELLPTSHTPHPTPYTQSSVLVGREVELAHLHGLLGKALHDERQLVLVTGEPGIGKTALVERFLESLGDRADLHISQGHCIEHYGSGEAYLPLFRIGARLCQGPEGAQVIALLRQYAPTWLLQLPGVLPESEWEQLQRRVQGMTRERMLRESAEAVVQFTREQGYVCVLEDLHWSDVSTLDWLSYIAQQREPAKLLIIGTYRPTEVVVSGHPLRGVMQDLQARGRCEEVQLAPLSQEAVSDYLRGRFEGAPLPPAVSGLIHRRTGGNPLFLMAVTEYLTDQGVVQEEDGQWGLAGDLQAVIGGVPDSLRRLIERQLERLPEEAQRLLEVASVVGMEFAAAAVAADLQVTVEAVEEQCDDLVRRGQFLTAQGSEAWPDGTLSERYSFRHALYRDVLYERLAETRRIRLHRRIGERKEAAYGERVSESAAELAVHFAHGRDLARAVRYCHRAGDNAWRRHGYREAIEHLQRGLALVQTLPDTPERAEQELLLHVALGGPLMVTKGYAAPEVEGTYARAHTLCQRVANPSVLFPVLLGLWGFYNVRAELHTACALGEQLLRLAERMQNPTFLAEAHHALGNTLTHLGEPVAARRHFEAVLTPPDAPPARVAALPSNLDPIVASHSYAAMFFWLLGYPERAAQSSGAGVRLAQDLSAPINRCEAGFFAGLLRLFRGEGAAALTEAETLISRSAECGLLFFEVLGRILRGGAGR